MLLVRVRLPGVLHDSQQELHSVEVGLREKKKCRICGTETRITSSGAPIFFGCSRTYLTKVTNH